MAKVEDDIINTSYYEQFEMEYRYLDTVIENAKNRDGVDFDEKTIDVLKKWYTESAIKQARALQIAFRRNQKVIIDTIILERIVQHNLKSGNWHFDPRDSTGNWHYARPIDIYDQIRKFKVGDPELMHLFLLLRDQIELWNTPELGWDHNNEYSGYDRRRGWFAEYHFPNHIFVQLKTVRDTLVRDSIYNRYQSLLPPVNLKNEGNQKYRNTK
ncbi:MAG: hypothetical protein IPL46_16875 [Saprospiraceae bacterium]|nr:hypothetical protein [Saprospiraceae bacterium]